MRKSTVTFIFLLLSLIMFSFVFYGQISWFAYSQETSEDWPMLQKNCQHTGSYSGSAPNSPQIKFMVNYTERNEGSSPIIVDDKVIIAGGILNYSLYALDLASGKLLWHSMIGFSTDSTPAFYNGRVVIPSSNGNLYCFNADNGNLIWTFRFTEGGYGNLPSPIIQNGVVYQGAGTTSLAQSRGSLYAISLFDMENDTAPRLVWKHFLNSTTTSSATYFNGRILVSYGTHEPSGGYLACLDSDSGTTLWEKEDMGSRVAPVVADGRIFCFGEGGFNCINSNSGETLWTVPVDNIVEATPAIANSRLYIGTLAQHGPDIPASLSCLNAETGELFWKHTFPRNENAATSPVVADGKVFLSSYKRIYAFNTADGQIIWNYTFIDGGGSSPAISSGALYMKGNKGFVFAFGVPEYFQLRIGSQLGNVTGADFYPINSDAQISATSPLNVAEGTRYVFTGWTGDFVSEEMTGTIRMDDFKTVFANWKLQYYLNVSSAFGNPQGEGWYDANSTATFSVNPTEGLIIQNRFLHWVDDSTSSDATVTILMDGPKKVTAVWENNQSNSLLLVGITIGTVVGVLVSLAAYFKYKRNKNRPDMQEQLRRIEK